MEFANKHCHINESQYGSRGAKMCQSAIFNEILTFDILRITCTTAAME